MTFFRTRTIAYCSVAVPHKPENQQGCLYITCNYLAIALLLCCLFRTRVYSLAIHIFQAFQPNTTRAKQPINPNKLPNTLNLDTWHYHFPNLGHTASPIASSLLIYMQPNQYHAHSIKHAIVPARSWSWFQYNHKFSVTLLIKPTQVRIHHKRTLSIYTLFKPWHVTLIPMGLYVWMIRVQCAITWSHSTPL